VSPGRDEKQTNIDAALPACGKILGPLGDTGPQRARLFFESPTRAGIQLCPVPVTLDEGSYTPAASRSGESPRRPACG